MAKPLTNQEIALRVIAARKWRNGHLMELAIRALSGEVLDRELDSDCTVEQWNKLLQGEETW